MVSTRRSNHNEEETKSNESTRNRSRENKQEEERVVEKEVTLHLYLIPFKHLGLRVYLRISYLIGLLKEIIMKKL